MGVSPLDLMELEPDMLCTLVAYKQWSDDLARKAAKKRRRR
jgi:hypothetical protein